MLEKFEIDVVDDILYDALLGQPDIDLVVENLKYKIDQFASEHEVEWNEKLKLMFDMSSPFESSKFKEEYITLINHTNKEDELTESILAFLDDDMDFSDGSSDFSEDFIKNTYIEIIDATDADELVDIVLL